jgi:hypothetical protein
MSGKGDVGFGMASSSFRPAYHTVQVGGDLETERYSDG